MVAISGGGPVQAGLFVGPSPCGIRGVPSSEHRSLGEYVHSLGGGQPWRKTAQGLAFVCSSCSFVAIPWVNAGPSHHRIQCHAGMETGALIAPVVTADSNLRLPSNYYQEMRFIGVNQKKDVPKKLRHSVKYD